MIKTIFHAHDWRGIPHDVYVSDEIVGENILKVCNTCGERIDGFAYVSPEARKQEVVDSIDKVLEDSGAARPVAESEQSPLPTHTEPAPAPWAAPRATPAAPPAAPAVKANDPGQSVIGFAGDTASLLTGDIEIKDGGSEKLRP